MDVFHNSKACLGLAVIISDKAATGMLNLSLVKLAAKASPEEVIWPVTVRFYPMAPPSY